MNHLDKLPKCSLKLNLNKSSFFSLKTDLKVNDVTLSPLKNSEFKPQLSDINQKENEMILTNILKTYHTEY